MNDNYKDIGEGSWDEFIEGIVREVVVINGMTRSPYRLEVGDIVRIDFNGAQLTLCFRGKIRKIPFSQGDCLVVEDLDTDKVYHISEPCTITKIKGLIMDMIDNKQDPLYLMDEIERSGEISVESVNSDLTTNKSWNHLRTVIEGQQNRITQLEEAYDCLEGGHDTLDSQLGPKLIKKAHILRWELDDDSVLELDDDSV